jgi:hypothetical protein
MQTQPMQTQPMQTQPMQTQPMQSNINDLAKIVNDVQHASSTGATQLPPNHIPMNSAALEHTVDPSIHPHYIPNSPANNRDFVQDQEEEDRIIKSTDNNNNNNNNTNMIDSLYTEMQIPLLLAVLYFMFQLPFFKKTHYAYLPSLFSDDGNYNLKGFAFTSICFGSLYRVISGYI